MKLAHEILDLNNNDFGPLSRSQIFALCRAGMITPFLDSKIRTDVEGHPLISYGLSEAGYDITLGYKFKEPVGKMDPKNSHYRDVEHHEPFDIPPHSFVLGESIERFDIPRDIRVIAISKSTNLRSGIFVPISPLEPGWRGVLTVEVANLGNEEATPHPGEGIAQLLFGLIHEVKGYEGAYQDQKGVTGALGG